MGDIDAVRAAVDEVVASFEDIDDDTRRRIPDTTVSVLVSDLDTAFYARFTEGLLGEVTEIDTVDFSAARLKITMSSDTLIDVVEGRLNFGTGWAKGKIKVDARLRDLFELRRFL